MSTEISSSSSNSTQIHNDNRNNWTDNNIKTLRAWKASLAKALFIYQYVLEIFEKKNNKIKVIVLIFSVISTIISAISTYALTNKNDPTSIIVALIINIIMILINGTMSFLNGYVQIYNLDKKVKIYTTYIAQLDNLYSNISSELILPYKLRTAAFEYIKNKNEAYQNLLKNNPNIPSSEHNLAIKQYNKFIENSSKYLKFAEKYKENDTIIEVV